MLGRRHAPAPRCLSRLGGSVGRDQCALSFLRCACVGKLSLASRSSALAERTASSRAVGSIAADSLPLLDQISDIHGTRDQTPQHAETEIRLEPGSTVPTAAALPDAAGSTTVDSTGRTGSGAFFSCLQPAVISAEAKMLAMTIVRVMSWPIPVIGHGLAGAEQLAAVDDDTFSGLKSGLDHHRSGFVTADRRPLQATPSWSPGRRPRPRAYDPEPSERSTAK